MITSKIRKSLSPLDFYYAKDTKSINECINELGFKSDECVAFKQGLHIFFAFKEKLDPKVSLVVPEPLLYGKLLEKELDFKDATFLIFEEKYAYIVSFKDKKLDFFTNLPACGTEHFSAQNKESIKAQILSSLPKTKLLLSYQLPFDINELPNTPLKSILTKDFKTTLLKRFKQNEANLSIKIIPSKKRFLVLACTLSFIVFSFLIYDLLLDFKITALKAKEKELLTFIQTKTLKKQKALLGLKNAALKTKEKRQELKRLENVYKDLILKDIALKKLTGDNETFTNIYKIFKLTQEEGVVLNKALFKKNLIKLLTTSTNIENLIALMTKSSNFYLSSQKQSLGLVELILKDKNASF